METLYLALLGSEKKATVNNMIKPHTKMAVVAMFVAGLLIPWQLKSSLLCYNVKNSYDDCRK